MSCRTVWTAPAWPTPYRWRAIHAEAAHRAALHPEIRPGTHVLARCADGRLVHKVAATPIVAGYDFPVVWVRWPSARDRDALPWPSEAVAAFDPTQARPARQEANL